MKEKKSTVYGIRCKTTGRIYIGCTSEVNQRIATHFKELHRKQKLTTVYVNGHTERVPSLFQKEYDEYGESDFDVYIIEQDVDKSKRSEREDFWMDYYKSTNPKYGYNRYASVRKDAAFRAYIYETPPRINE